MLFITFFWNYRLIKAPEFRKKILHEKLVYVFACKNNHLNYLKNDFFLNILEEGWMVYVSEAFLPESIR